MISMATVPILKAFFTSSGFCLHVSEDTLDLPVLPYAMRKQLKAQYGASASVELGWRDYFLQNDLEKNVQFEWPHVLKNPSQLNVVSYDCVEPGTFERIVRTVQFFKKSANDPLDNQALVTYYYDNMKLCDFQICIKFKNTARVLARYEHHVNATIHEHKELMGWYLTGKSVFENPYGFTNSGRPLCYIRAYRRAALQFPQQIAKKANMLCENCFVYEREEDIYDDVGNIFYDAAHDKYLGKWMDEQIDELDAYSEYHPYSFDYEYYYQQIVDEAQEKMYNSADKAYEYNAMWQLA